MRLDRTDAVSESSFSVRAWSLFGFSLWSVKWFVKGSSYTQSRVRGFGRSKSGMFVIQSQRLAFRQVLEGWENT